MRPLFHFKVPLETLGDLKWHYTTPNHTGSRRAASTTKFQVPRENKKSREEEKLLQSHLSVPRPIELDQLPVAQHHVPDGSAEEPEAAERPISRDLDLDNFNLASNSKPDFQTVPSFLRLPVEIRLDIYKWALLMHPINKWKIVPRSTHISFGPAWCSPAALAILDSIPGAITSNKDCQANNKDASIQRPLCRLPTALLRANKQIYYEARTIPFVTNEFVFGNHTRSGLWMAQTFATTLEKWQRELLRFLRLELRYHDFASAKQAQGWIALCQAFSNNLKGLRIMIGTCSSARHTSRHGGSRESVGSSSSNREDVLLSKLSNSDLQALRWFVDGLGMLRKLELLEVELHLGGWHNQKSLEWCQRLERMLDGGRFASSNKISVMRG